MSSGDAPKAPVEGVKSEGKGVECVGLKGDEVP